MALRSRGLPLGSPPPVLAAMVISFDNLLKILPRLASIAPLKRLTFDHLLCPDIGAELFFDLSCLTTCCNFGTAPRKRMAGEEELPALVKPKKPGLSIFVTRRLRQLIARDYFDEGKSV